ncbi:MAG: isoprenylcysteine carboxylmethyltransferase family protein [Deltaproteobacteria bacterium]|nr:isoprenylcysteine carboxylmethyltransferase family protein [Candidatus Zymogenaceae bacterium]
MSKKKATESAPSSRGADAAELRIHIVEKPQTAEEESPKRFFLNRGNLRDAVVAMSIVLSLLLPVGIEPVRISFALFVLLAGIGLHLLVKGQLIRNKVLCTEGTYGLVRHPFYLANFSIDLSLCLIVGNIYLIALYPFLFFWAYGPTLKVENERLSKIHGEGYTKYESKVPEIFPSPLSIGVLRIIFRGFSWSRITKNEVLRIIRFCSVASLLIIIQDVRTEGLGELIFPFTHSHPADYDAVIMVMVLLSLFVVYLSTRVYNFVHDRDMRKQGL